MCGGICTAGKKVFLFFIRLGFQSSFFLQPVPATRENSHGWLFSRPCGMEAALTACPQITDIPIRLLEKLRLKAGCEKQKDFFLPSEIRSRPAVSYFLIPFLYTSYFALHSAFTASNSSSTSCPGAFVAKLTATLTTIATTKAGSSS